MEIRVPEFSLILLAGASGSGKSTFARKHFGPYEVISSDECRGWVSNDPNSLDATKDAFELLQFMVGQRLKRGLLTVVDATNVQQEARKKLLALAKEYHAIPAIIVLNLPQRVSEDRNTLRPDRNFGKHVVRQQKQQLNRSLKNLKAERFRKIYVLNSEEEVNAVSGIIREPLFSNKKDIHGPFDIIGDIHGCIDETRELLAKLGYVIENVAETPENFGIQVSHPENRKVIFLGDLVDRGPDSPAVLKLVMSMVRAKVAWCVPGNHDIKLKRKLDGKKVQVKHGLETTLAQLEGEPEAFLSQIREFIYSLTSHYVFDDGNLVVTHAGLKEDMQGRGSGAVRAFCLYGETTGEIDEFGLPVRYNWASDYRGKAKVVYGHTPVPEAEWLNRTIDIDTGCVFGGKLTALRYPEEELVSVPAKKVWCEPKKPLLPEAHSELSHQQEYDDLLDIEDVSGKRIIQSRLRNNITIREENSIAALEVMSRFAIHPKWLIYLPPTMSPCETSELPGYLEHPAEAIGYYAKNGIEKVICEEKHMGSRAVLVICKDESVAKERFGLADQGYGICYTRTGRNFFSDTELEAAFLAKVREALNASGIWESLETDWICLDAELMPWSAKAQALLKDQYAAVGAAASNALPEVQKMLQMAAERGIPGTAPLSEQFSQKEKAVFRFVDAYRQYCWEVNSVEDYKLAPFHILATEGAVHVDKSHAWHMEKIEQICAAAPEIMFQTRFEIVETANPASVQKAIDWWMEMTGKGGEGMVVKPLDFVAYGKKGLLQPAVKCRGREYLRIIYGPEYDLPHNIERLRNRGLSRKRSLALREFALGMESLERFVRKEPLRKVHESVFGVLALESESVDPRL